ncbi:MAG: radical SAM protein [Nanoarchaeota archaeon]|nr:radical SAM protein [Nanoarchaeota archaeon]
MIKQIPRIFYKKGMKPIYLIFNVTNRCNANCSICFAWKYLNKDADKELKIEEIKKISSSMGNIEWLLMSGGEPFLRSDLDEIINVFYKQNKVRRVTIPTNAVLTEKMQSDITSTLSQCPKLKLVISLSIDGVGKEHDVIRGFPGNFKNLENTYSMLVKLKRRFSNLSINMNTCLSNKNISKLDKLLEYCENNFSDVDFHGFELLRGVPKDISFKTPSVSEYKVALKKIKRYWIRLKFYNMGFSKVLKATKILARDIELDILAKGIKTPCFAGSIAGVVSAMGDVSLCELWPPVGNLRDTDYDFKKVWFNENAMKQRNQLKRREGMCKQCTHSCFVSSAMLFDPLLYPKLLKYTLNVFLEKNPKEIKND